MAGYMKTFLRSVSVPGFLLLFLAGSPLAAQGRQGGPPPPRPQPRRSLRIEYPPLFFREDWKLDPNAPNVNTADEPEHPVGQGDVANPNLEVHVYGDKAGTRIANQTYNNQTYAMTLLCTSNCAITLRDKNNDVDLSGVATLRWRTRISGFHYLRPIIKLADGTWLIGDQAAGLSTNFVESEIQLVDVRWRRLDIENVIEASDGYWVDYPDLSRVEEIGFTDLMRGAGHGSGGGSRIDWIEVYGKPVPRTASPDVRNSNRAPSAIASANKVKSFDHLVINVSDMERALAFYKRLGFTLINEEGWRKGQGQVSIKIGENQKINIHKQDKVGPQNKPEDTGPSDKFNLAYIPLAGGADFCLVWGGTIQEAQQFLRDSGVEHISAPRNVAGARGPATSVYFRDPDGNLWELMVYS
jgi:catechol 2,3-dioxygenase-like lactoylglutathione lyase family enzyme